MKIRLPALALLLLSALALGASAARADTPAFTTGGEFSPSGGSNATTGYTFALAAPVQVTALGFWDYQADGLSAPIPVTLWNAAGVAQAQATVPAGTAAGEINQYLYVTLAAPVLLPVGTYTLGGYLSTGTFDVVQRDVSTITAAPGVTYGEPRFGSGTGAPAGNPVNRTQGYFGPNFQFVVPEPSARVGLFLGLLAAAGGLTRRARARAAVLFLGLLAAATPAARAALAITDQQNTAASTGTFFTNSLLAQSFTPALASLDAATFSLSANNGPASVRLDVLAGAGIGGTVLASSPVLTLTNTAAQTVEFDLAAPLVLTPGRAYTLRLIPTSGSFSGAYSGDTYTGGQFYAYDTPTPVRDLLFAEGLAAPAGGVPEPSAWAAVILFLDGAGALLLVRRVRAIRREKTLRG